MLHITVCYVEYFNKLGVKMKKTLINKKTRFVYTTLLCCVLTVFVSTITACGGAADQISDYPIEVLNQGDTNDIEDQDTIDSASPQSDTEPLGNSELQVDIGLQGNSGVIEPQASNAQEGPHNAIAISAARRHTLALMQDGTLWAWGVAEQEWNREEEDWSGNQRSLVGDGTTESRHRPVQIMEDVTLALAGNHHSLAITADGGLWAWGCNQWGQLGDGTTEDRLSPVKVLDDVVYATMPSYLTSSRASGGVAGVARSYAILADGSLWAWGANGQQNLETSNVALGDGTEDTQLTPVKILENVVSVAPTHESGFALTNDGTVWRWYPSSRVHDGEGWVEVEGQLYPAPIMENVASLSSEFAISTDGELWALLPEPALVMDDVIGASGESFAITTDGTLWAWGKNLIQAQYRIHPVLGDGTTVDRDSPVAIMENVASITTSGNTAYAITNDGTLWGWGNSGASQDTPILIGDGSIFSTQDVGRDMWEPAASPDYLATRWLLDDDGGTGLRLAPVMILEDVVDVAATFYRVDHGWINGFRTFALTKCGSVWAWGVNNVWPYEDSSLLGDGTSELRAYPVRIIEGDL